MKITLKLLGISFLMLCLASPLMAQVPGNISVEDVEEMDDEEGYEEDGPLDDIVEKRTTLEKRVLPYDDIREADLFWEKRIWRVIDIREKMNLPFAYPERPFFSILMDAAESGEITVYSAEDDKFTSSLTPEEVSSMGASIDTVTTFDPVTYEEKIH